MNDTPVSFGGPGKAVRKQRPVLSMMSRPAILRALEAGQIVIDPFDERHLNTASYDVTLGKHFYREAFPRGKEARHNIYQFADSYGSMFNPYNEEAVEHCWLYEQAMPATYVFGDEPAFSYIKAGIPKGIHPDDRVLVLEPQELVLAHTIEFIGTTTPDVKVGIQHTTEMHSRSTSVRSFIDVCGSGGFGDHGFSSRWTMEICNNSRFHHVPLVVGRRYAQISFFQTEPLPPGESYARDGKYQTSSDLEELKKKWSPTQMLPLMYKDWEVPDK